ncbi:MAG: biotin--[acetyl-CoA-carboxylase] ligase [Candidatus Eisenbacteria sp.]|nr:biotin--[acetyl-CoA-carboxylase] ligase [Candidatus Eisenbacteria bacterium]
MPERQSSQAKSDDRGSDGDLDQMRLEDACRGIALVRECFWFAQVDSTQEELRRRRDEVGPGTLIVADLQTAGRGRRGRSWFSPRQGLWFSLGVRPPRERREWPLITSIAGLALREALREVAGLSCGIKWPNDLLCRGRKIAGILAESSGKGGVALGAGVNLAQERRDFPPELRASATSVRLEAGRVPPRAPLLRAFLEAFRERLGRFSVGGGRAVREELRAASLLIGRWITLADGSGGRVADIAEEGGLILEPPATDSHADRRAITVTSGEIIAIEPPLDRT